MKILSVRTDMFFADGGTHMSKLTVAFRSFADAPKIINMDCKIKYFTGKKKWGVYDNTLDIEVGAL
jgi:hypothetical protein